MSDVIRLLLAIEEGDEQASDQLLPLVCQELRADAHFERDSGAILEICPRMAAFSAEQR